ncbi:VOC family protein [Cellulomonas sp. APG4]|uniref:VOC family protein n=1 Tax=Cellulomonas sp. APG4 TaxID=1538656 RepID=UPI0013793C98|nr:VOC family protein [Cellulomonas sp. APG4]NCT90184.1 VOC family protein [Cellulomonas sp. APG4]
MTMRAAMVTFDCRDARSLADWWARQTGGEIQADHDGWFVMVAPGPDGGPTLAFQQVAEPTPGKNRVHLDLIAPDRDLEVDRLLGEGALEVARHETPGFTWVVLSDPEGNQFCVSQAG